MSYITADDIKDKFINRAGMEDLKEYLDETDEEFVRLAEERSIFNSDSYSVDDDGVLTDHTVRRYLAYYLQYRFCEDHYGQSGSGNIPSDYYQVKMEIYRDRMNTYRQRVTYEMITGTVNERMDTTVNSGYMIRT